VAKKDIRGPFADFYRISKNSKMKNKTYYQFLWRNFKLNQFNEEDKYSKMLRIKLSYQIIETCININ
jgi:hypothetical protein